MVTATKRQPSRPTRRDPAVVTDAVKAIAKALAEANDLVLWDIAYVRDAGRETLRVACDRVGGVNADDLATYSEQLSRELDRTDVVPGEARYVLEVTSPGAERKLVTPEQFRVCVGRQALVVLRDGRTVEGPIAAVTDRSVEISGEEEGVRALFDDIAKAQLVVKL
jgi:ribosome maturation factor RimP